MLCPIELKEKVGLVFTCQQDRDSRVVWPKTVDVGSLYWLRGSFDSYGLEFDLRW